MQNINVNIVPDNFPQTIRYSQGDIGRQFKINVADFEIPVGATVKIQATKPSGFGFSVAGVVSDNSVTFTTTEEMTDEAGRFQAELQITAGGDVIGTANFLMIGERNPHPEGTTDGSQGTIIPELTLLVERVEKAASDILDMEVVATTLPAGSQATYSYDEDLNKATFGIPEGQAGAGAAGVVASAYSAAKTYKVGDYVLYNSNLYRCTTAITTAEAWTAAHWTQVVLADDVTDLKSDLETEQDDGLYHRYLTWEHGGVDNYTGENNNEGSLTRSRVADYMLVSDYVKIVNDSQSIGYVIYYNANKRWLSNVQLTVGGTVTLNDYFTYFRLDLRGGLEQTNYVKVYQNSALKNAIDSVQNNIHYNRYAQIYFNYDSGIIEEDTSSKKVYISTTTSFALRYGKGGNVKKISTISIGQLATELGVSLVTSPKGVENCVAIPDEYALAYNTSTEQYQLVHRYSLTDDHIIILIQNGGFVTGANAYMLKTLTSQESDDETGIPSYWDSAIAEAETSINTYLKSDEKSASFGFVTDTHSGANRGYSGLLMDKVLTDCHIPVWFHGGDAVKGYDMSYDGLIAEMNADFEQFKSIENIGLRAIGNHDVSFDTNTQNDSNLKNGEANHYYHGIDREKYLQVYGEEKGYFYKDIHKDKLRCICLDIIPYESQVDSNDVVTGANKWSYYQFGSKQLEWFASVLSETPKDYSVVVCSHIAPISLAELQTLDASWDEFVPIDYLQARKIAEAYALKSTYAWSGSITGDLTGDSYDIDVDFSSAQGTFVCFFCGHTHKDFGLTLDNVLIVGTANDSLPPSVNAPSYAPSKTSGTNTEQIIDFFCVLPTSQKLYVVRLGAYLQSNGKVREFDY